MLQRARPAAAGADPAGRARRLLAQHQLRRPGGEPLPARPGRLVDQQRVRQAALREGGRDRLRLAGDPGRERRSLARPGRGIETRERGGDAMLDLRQRRGRIDDVEALGLAPRKLEVPRAHALEELDRLGLEAIGAAAGARAGAR